jgi:hypothetical protein
MDTKQSADQYSPEETERRRDEAIRRALGTPPKPQKELVGKSQRAKAQKQSRVKKNDK